MILSELDTIGKAIDVSGAAGAAFVGNTIDLHGGTLPGQNRDIGVTGVGYYMTVTVTSQLTGADITVTAISDTTETPAGAVKRHGAVDIPESADVGYRKSVKVAQGEPYDQYLGAEVNRAGTVTGGVLDISFTIDPPSWYTYEDADNSWA